MKKLFIVFCSYLLISCCSNDELVIKINPDDNKIVDIDSISDSSNCFIIDDSLHLVGEVVKMIKSDKYVYFLERCSHSIISCYNLETGKLVFLIDDYGRGPKEYVDIEDFIVDEKRGCLTLYERNKQRLLNYSMNKGEYISDINIGKYFTQFCVNDKGDYLLWRDDGDYHLQLYSRDFDNCKLNAFPLYIELLDIPKRFCQSADSVFFAKILDDNLYVLKDNKIHTLCCIDFGKYSVPQSVLEIADEDVRMSSLSKGNYALGISNLNMCNSSLVFSYSYKQKLNTAVLTGENKIYNYGGFISEKYGLEFDFPFCSDNKELYGLVYLDENVKELKNGIKTNLNPVIISFDINKL